MSSDRAVRLYEMLRGMWPLLEPMLSEYGIYVRADELPQLIREMAKIV